MISIHVISWLWIMCIPLILEDWDRSITWKNIIRGESIPVFSFILFYINYLWLVPKYLLNRKYFSFLLPNVVLVVVLSLFIHLIRGSWLAPEPHLLPDPSMGPPVKPDWFFISRHFIILSFVVGLSTALRISMRWRETEDKLVKAEREKADAELMNLKNQVSPHFLLNTLNNIYALIAFNQEKAQDAVQQLSKLLRHMLYDNQTSLVPLKNELDFISNYIALMRIRLSDSVKLSVKLDAGNRQLMVAPYIFISLIENAFKHGVSATEKCVIDIDIQGDEDGCIRCQIINSNFPKKVNDKSGSGIGLEQVYRRLELTYPNQYTWTKHVSADGKTYTSLLIIETQK